MKYTQVALAAKLLGRLIADGDERFLTAPKNPSTSV
jgi:hypothetical protein